MKANNNIIRVQKNKENPYVMLNKECINDSNITWAAKGLHAYLLSLPDDWTIYVSELVKHTSAGRDHTYTVIRELIKNGYMQRFEQRYKGRVISAYYVVYENKIDVDLDKLTKTMATIINLGIDENDQYYIIEENVGNTTSEPNPENTYMDTTDMVNTKLLINNSTNKELKLNNNNVVDVAEPERTQSEKVIDLYKTFKIQKKLMPQMIALLNQYSDKISLEVFEYIFIQAAEESVLKKYNYIKELLKKFYANKILTMNDLEKYNKEFKDKKDIKKVYSKPKTRFHNHKQTFLKYGEQELEQVLEESQEDKFEKSYGFEEDAYRRMVENNWTGLSSYTQKVAIKYAKENNLPYIEKI